MLHNKSYMEKLFKANNLEMCIFIKCTDLTVIENDEFYILMRKNF